MLQRGVSEELAERISSPPHRERGGGGGGGDTNTENEIRVLRGVGSGAWKEAKSDNKARS